MEQHPVPQNVTTFQFRLVGDMTIKQFGYVAVGVLLAYISYKMPLPFFFRYPLALIFGLGGFGLAFVPVQEQPMDIWIGSFIKNVYSPTQYVWQKAQVKEKASTVKTTHQGETPPDGAAAELFHRLFQTQQKPHISQTPTIGNLFSSLDRFFDPLAARARRITFSNPFTQVQPVAAKPIVSNRLVPTATAPPKEEPKPHFVADTQKGFSQFMKAAKEDAPKKSFSPAISLSSVAPSQQTVRVITQEAAVGAGLPKLTTFPNIVTGIVKDERGNLLPGALVTVRDKEGVPLRALKTNKLGQFAASTPLPDGTYVVEIEDPKNIHTFDRAQITLTGAVMPALEVVAKSRKQIERDRLAKAIFGNQN